jgi:hypothetical protein
MVKSSKHIAAVHSTQLHVLAADAHLYFSINWMRCSEAKRETSVNRMRRTVHFPEVQHLVLFIVNVEPKLTLFLYALIFRQIANA